jgi:hypothetical protein
LVGESRTRESGVYYFRLLAENIDNLKRLATLAKKPGESQQIAYFHLNPLRRGDEQACLPTFTVIDCNRD